MSSSCHFLAAILFLKKHKQFQIMRQLMFPVWHQLELVHLSANHDKRHTLPKTVVCHLPHLMQTDSDFQFRLPHQDKVPQLQGLSLHEWFLLMHLTPKQLQ
jgi:hypothetical protein